MSGPPHRPAGKAVLGLAGLAGVALVLSGCGSLTTAAAPEDVAAGSSTGTPARVDCELPDGAIAIAGVGRAGMPAVQATPGLSAVLEHAQASGATLTVLDTDADPTVLGSDSFAVDGNDRYQAKHAEQKVGQVEALLAGSTPDAAEADPLAALTDAARAVHASTPTGTVVLMDSGLGTRGALDYAQDGLLLAEPAELAQALASAGQLPDLNGLAVVLIGIGETADPQGSLDTATRERLIRQWTTLTEAAGASCVAVDDTPMSAAPAPGLPTVTPVTVPDPAPLRISSETPLALRADKVAFVSDSADLLDPTAAEQALEPIAEQLVATGADAELVGTTATDGTPEGRRRLSEQRAATVQQVLVGLGVPADRLTASGVGTDHPAHVDDTRPDGTLKPGPAAQNRAVFVTVLG